MNIVDDLTTEDLHLVILALHDAFENLERENAYLKHENEDLKHFITTKIKHD